MGNATANPQPSKPDAATYKKSVRASVNAKAADGSLRDALSRGNIPEPAVSAMVNDANSRRALRSRYVENGAVRYALKNANWTEDEIEFIIYRSLAIIDMVTA